MNDWLVVDGVCHRFGVTSVLSDISFRLPRDERILVIVGPSGIGKSTLVRLLAGHIQPSAGSMTILGETVRSPSPRRPMVFQGHNLFPWKTVLENVTFGLKCKGMPKAQRTAVAISQLRRLGMPESSYPQYPSQLSGGMQQRVGLARALAVGPSCILMDEPFSALDDNMRALLCDQISQISAENGTYFVIVTHDLSDAAFLADRALVFLRLGCLVETKFEPAASPRSRNFRFSQAFQGRLEQLRAVIGSGSERDSLVSGVQA